jgi:hypothetical protein
MTSPVLVVAAAVVDDLDEPRVLLSARRATPASLAGRWEFPGGKVDAGETPATASDASAPAIAAAPGHETARGGPASTAAGPCAGPLRGPSAHQRWLLLPEQIIPVPRQNVHSPFHRLRP